MLLKKNRLSNKQIKKKPENTFRLVKVDIKLFHFLHEPSRFISQPKGLAANEIRDRPGEDIHLRTERLHIVTRGKFSRTSEHFPAGSNSGASNDSLLNISRSNQ